jgi:hypothetical protein
MGNHIVPFPIQVLGLVRPDAQKLPTFKYGGGVPAVVLQRQQTSKQRTITLNYKNDAPYPTAFLGLYGPIV